MRAELVPLSRHMARVLRHKPAMWGLKLDREGWTSVQALLAGAAEHGFVLSEADLQEIVATNDKRRFSFSPDKTRIRAVQGHSVPVELGLKPSVPPPVLFHGTIRKYLPAILRDGLLPMKRHAVQLSSSKDSARWVGARKGLPVVLLVDSMRMHRDGCLFWRSENGVWLTPNVPAQYLTADGGKR